MSIPGRESTNQPSSSKIRKCVSCLKDVLNVDRPIFHLPCLHSLCFKCRDAQKVNLDRFLHCTYCNQQFSADVVYDEYIPDSRRTKCGAPECYNNEPQRITHYCLTCTVYLCGYCLKNHNRQHNIRESKNYIPMISRCINSAHYDRTAVYVCGCGARLCNECLDSHRSACRKSNTIGTFTEINSKAINCLKPLMENDRKSLDYYHCLLQGLQIKRRMVMAEFQNSRTQLAYDCQRMVSLLIQRFNDLSDSLEMCQNQYMVHFKKVEHDITEETNRIATINNLEKKIVTLKQQDIIPFASFIKCASNFADKRGKYNKSNLDNILPLPSVRIDLAHSPQSSNFVQFLSGFGSVVVNNIRQTVRSNFDKPLAFVLPPKLNPAEMGHQAEMGLRCFNGKEYEKADKEKFRRLVKPLSDEELKERCFQLELELDYYKRLTKSLETDSKIGTENVRHLPVERAEHDSHIIAPQMNNVHLPGPSTSRSHPVVLNRNRVSMPNFGMGMQPPIRLNGIHAQSPQFQNSPQGFMFPQSPNHTNLLRNTNQSELQQLMFSNSPSNAQSSEIVTITLEDELRPNPNIIDLNNLSNSTNQTPSGIHENNQNNVTDKDATYRRSRSVVYHSSLRENHDIVSNSAPNSNAQPVSESPSNRSGREKSHDSHKSDKSGRYRAVPSVGLKIRIRREEVEPTPVNEEPFEALQGPSDDVDGEKSRKAQTTESQQDEWDDYCYSCNEGCDDISGDLGCCSSCPKVFHQLCHSPRCTVPMAQLPDEWRCSICTPLDPITEWSEYMTPAISLACSKVLLACLDDSQQSDPFRKPVDKKFLDYYTIISRPMDFTTINTRLSNGFYSSPKHFIADMNQVFINCSTFNSPENPLAKCGINVYKKYMEAVKKHMPVFSGGVWMYVCLHKDDEPVQKKRRRNQ
ncbi:unnamed protein product [Bursaphelenchus okinawaensis]|uniref:Uncharacterized protein n=1 Tax=Bursaphelenchus okinawaensis TaxID=465554 RepID=A0A811KKL7_9BILA|nr:unnamed protein product [Bursaphelenchus okinawaensis]CAG9104470.1 unnamed protein product [Bursaphelenchus okinawaensis]